MAFAEMALGMRGLTHDLPAGVDGKTPLVKVPDGKGGEKEVPGVYVNCYSSVKDGGPIHEVAHNRAQMLALGVAPAAERYFPRVASAGTHPLFLAFITAASVFARPSEAELKRAAAAAERASER